MNPAIARLLCRVMMLDSACFGELLTLAASGLRGFEITPEQAMTAMRSSAPGPLDPARMAREMGVSAVSVTSPSAAKPYIQVGSTAIIDIWGVLDQNDDDVQFTWGSRTIRWGTSYQMIRRDYAAAMADESVKGILLRCNSPGGDAMAVEQVALAIHGTRGATKKAVALADTMIGSAMLFLAAQATAVYTTPGGWVGSIGTICHYADYSKAYADFGVVINTIKSHAGKDAGSPYRAMSEQDREKLQAEVNAYGAQFDAALRRGRGVDQATVDNWKTTQRGYVGDAAVKNGLVDGVVSDVYALIAQMEKAYTQAPAKGGGRAGASAETQGDGDMFRHFGFRLNPIVGDGGGGGGAGGAAPTNGAAPPGNAGGGGGASVAEVQAAREGERKRITTIQDRINGLQLGSFAAHAAVVGALGQKAIAEGWTPERFSDEALMAIAKASSPTGHVSGPAGGGGQSGLSDAQLRLSVTADEREKKLSGVEAALLPRLYGGLDAALSSAPTDDATRPSRIAEALGYSSAADVKKAIVTARGGGFGRAPFYELACHAIAAGGVMSFDAAVRMFREEPTRFMANAFHTTSDFPKLMANLSNKVLLARYAEVRVVWNQICLVESANDYKSAPIISMSNMGNFETLPEGRTPKHTTFDERQESIAVEAAGIRFGLTYQAMRNDDLNAFGQRLQMMGNSAARVPEDKFFALLAVGSGVGPAMSDGNALFHSSHNNISTQATLSYDAAQKDVTQFRKQKTFGSNPVFIDVDPSILLVPVDLQWLAEDLAMQPNVPGTAASPSAATQTNVLKGRFKPLATPRLTGTRRYWFANPTQHPVIVMRFLDGKQTPEIVELPLNDPMKMEFQATTLGIGIAAAQWEGALTNAG